MDDTMFERLIEVRDDLRLMNNDSGAAAVEWAIVQLVGPPPSAIVDATDWAEAAFEPRRFYTMDIPGGLETSDPLIALRWQLNGAKVLAL
jgi:hypothetical protein